MVENNGDYKEVPTLHICLSGHAHTLTHTNTHPHPPTYPHTNTHMNTLAVGLFGSCYA